MINARELSVAQLAEKLLRYADDIESEGRSYAPVVMREAARRLTFEAVPDGIGIGSGGAGGPRDQKGASRS